MNPYREFMIWALLALFLACLLGGRRWRPPSAALTYFRSPALDASYGHGERWRARSVR